MYAFPVVTGRGKNKKRIGWFNFDQKLTEQNVAKAGDQLLSWIEAGFATYKPVSSGSGATYLTIQIQGTVISWFQPENDELPGDVYALLSDGKAKVERFELSPDVNSVLDSLLDGPTF